MAEKEIEIQGQKFVIKEYNWDEHLEIEKNSLQITVDPQTQKPVPVMDMKQMKMLALKFGLVKAPFEITEKQMGKQPKAIMEALFTEIDNYNNVDKKKP